MSTDTLQTWLNTAGSFPLLSRAETLETARTIQAWRRGEISDRLGLRAVNRLVNANLRLVVQTWRKQLSYVRGTDHRVLDILQEGAIGLREAALKFDPTRGYTFSTYACPWIRKGMNEYLRDRERTIRISSDCYGAVNASRRFIAAYQAEHGNSPSMEQIAEVCKTSVKTTKFFLERYAMTSKTSLNAPLRGAEDMAGEVGDFVCARPEYDAEAAARAEKLEKVLEVIFEKAGLNGDEKLAIRERHLNTIPLTYDKINELFSEGTKTRALNVCARAMNRCSKAVSESSLTMATILERA